jgi:ABC-type nitrate/sulfonate/bicarbonate transport system permease component
MLEGLGIIINNVAIIFIATIFFFAIFGILKGVKEINKELKEQTEILKYLRDRK